MGRQSLRGFLLLVFITTAFVVAVPQHSSSGAVTQPTTSTAASGWAELSGSMERMHGAMHSVKPSGDNDVDFVRLMIPHHQAAIDMAKSELVHGKDPQMRRLAQEIIADQQSEIEVMKLWLKQHHSTE